MSLVEYASDALPANASAPEVEPYPPPPPRHLQAISAWPRSPSTAVTARLTSHVPSAEAG